MAERWEDWFEPGETLLWEGAPAPGFRHAFRNVFFTAFGIPFLGAGLFTSGMGLGFLFSGEGWNLLLGVIMFAFGIPFIAVGAGMVFGGWVEEYLKPKRVRYALSDQNGYVASRMWKRNMEVLPLRADSRVETVENSDGSLSIYFHFENHIDSDGDRQTTKKGFENLRDGHHVYRMIRNLQTGQGVGPPGLDDREKDDE